LLIIFYSVKKSVKAIVGHNKKGECLSKQTEAYYNLAITPWMKLTPDIQVIRPAQEDKVSVVSTLPPVITREGIDTSYVAWTPRLDMKEMAVTEAIKRMCPA
jgi:hypothetical protein